MTYADSRFKGHRFDRRVIVLCIRWYVTYKLSYRDLVEMMMDSGGVDVAYDDPALGGEICAGR